MGRFEKSYPSPRFGTRLNVEYSVSAVDAIGSISFTLPSYD
jgi:hypothetical protein